MSAVDPRWYEDFFGDDWLAIARTVTDPERTVRQVDFVVDRLALEPGARILDLACGHGRRIRRLAAHRPRAQARVEENGTVRRIGRGWPLFACFSAAARVSRARKR